MATTVVRKVTTTNTVKGSATANKVAVADSPEEIAIMNNLKLYIKESTALDVMSKAFRGTVQKGMDTKFIDYRKVEYRAYTTVEERIYGDYTDATCREAKEATLRETILKRMWLLALIFLIMSIILLLCCCGISCWKVSKLRRKNNYFGHNNGEDRLIIDHHW